LSFRQFDSFEFLPNNCRTLIEMFSEPVFDRVVQYRLAAGISEVTRRWPFCLFHVVARPAGVLHGPAG
jgi:hypothetical protein